MVYWLLIQGDAGEIGDGGSAVEAEEGGREVGETLQWSHDLGVPQQQLQVQCHCMRALVTLQTM